MLNMRSVEERTAAARIRDAAIGLFAAEGFGGATVRAIAAAADVSPGLVIHHFGSKEGLRAACDEYVLEVTTTKLAALSEGGDGLSGLQGLVSEGLPVLPYLTRAFTEGGPAAAHLYDRLVDTTETTLADWGQAGRVQPTPDPRMRAALVVAWDLSVLVLAEHITRTTGSDPRQPDGLARWTRVATDLLLAGLLRPGPWLDDLRAAVASLEDAADTSSNEGTP